MKRTKILIIFLSFFLLSIKNVNAEEVSSNKEGYVINNYDVSITVDENKKCHVTETIDAYFYEKRHGIYRNLAKSIKINDKEEKVKITNIFVSENFEKAEGFNTTTLKIGSSNKEITGNHTYKINYTYEFKLNSLNVNDDFYFNMIDNDWKVPIKKVSFNIKMPKSIEGNKAYFWLRNSNNKTGIGATYNVTDNVIEGYLNNSLLPNQGIMLNIDIPEGYFNISVNNIGIIQMLMPILILVIALLVWAIFGNSEEIIDTVEFYPPEGFNSLDLALAYKGKVDNRDVISLLIFLASKGYLKIVDSVNDSNFKIVKLKDYDGNNKVEKEFFDGLFSCKNNSIISLHMNKYKEEKNKKEDSLLEVASESLYYSFYRVIDKIKINTNYSKLKKELFTTSLNSDLIIISLMIISYFITNYNIMGNEIFNNIFQIIITCIGFYLIILGIIREGLWYQKIVKIILGLIISLPIWIYNILPFILAYTNNYIIYGIGIISIIAMLILTKDQEKRTTYGNELLGKIIGFKNFLEKAEKEQLEAMVEKNPSYFYDILPYTYVLDISKEWIKRFEELALKVPDWYSYGNSVGSSTQLSSFLGECYNKLNSRPLISIFAFDNNSSNDDSKRMNSPRGGSFTGGSGSSSGNGGSW